VTYTNAQVALQAAVADVASKRRLDESSVRAYYGAHAGSKYAPSPWPEKKYHVPDLAILFLKWLDEQDAGNVTVADLDERVSKLEGGK
jgi:hypothetical protein